MIERSAHLWGAADGASLAGAMHAGQRSAYFSQSRFTWMISGTQGGKTTFGPLWLFKTIRELGPGDYLAVTASYPLLMLKMLPEFLSLFQHTMPLGEWRKSERAFYLNDGSRVIFGSAQSPEALESATAKAAWLDECGQEQFKLQAYEAILRRLSLHQGRILGTTTPYNQGWLKQQVYDPWRAGDKDHNVIQFDSIRNPAFPHEEYERQKRLLPEWKFNMFYRGRFERPPGLIYNDYRDDLSSAGGARVDDDAIVIEPDWPRYVGVDFGAINTSLVWVAQDPATRVYYVYRDSLSGEKSTKEHVMAALGVAKGENVVSWHGGSLSEKQQRWDWSAAGIPVQPPIVSDVEAGIDRVISLFREKKLYVLSSCSGLRDELGSYQRLVDSSGEPTEQIKDKESFHRLDALRYVGQALGDAGLWHFA